MRWQVALFLGLMSLAKATEARACSCMELTPSEGLTSSRAVFSGEVVDIEPNNATPFRGLEITFRVNRVWKGEPNEEIKVHTAGSSAACGYPFLKGQEYLVYAVSDDADPMRVSLCSRTAPLHDAKKDLDYLGKPKHQLSGRSRGCSAQPMGSSVPGAGFALLLLAGLVWVVRRRWKLVLLMSLAVWIVGCSHAPSRPALTANFTDDDIPVIKLRAMNYEYAALFSQHVAACVLDIAAETDSGTVRDRAFQWRMWAAPQARAAAFDQDPFAGLLELRVLAGQQRQYFHEGSGRDYFGDQQQCALDTTTLLVDEVEAMAAMVVKADERDTLNANVKTWIDEHPIEGKLFVRPTARADLAGLVPEEKQGGLKAVGSIEETIRDMNDRITILTVQMPVEARWQAEYLIHSLFEERAQEPTAKAMDAIETMTNFLGEFESTLSAQTQTLLLGFEKERLAVFDAIGAERSQILEAIEEERSSITGKLDQQLATATDNLNQVGRGLIDHFFVRLVEVLAAVGVFSFLLVALVLVVMRRRGNRSGDD